MRTVREIPSHLVSKLRRTQEEDQRLERYLKTEIEDYISGLAQLYTRWQDYIRMYRGIPIEQFSKDPIPVRNIEVTVGATAVDTLVAQVTDMLNSAQPPVTVRSTSGQYDKEADAFQKLINHLAVDPFTNYQSASKDYRMDVVQLGTGLIYTTWQEDHKITGVEELVDWGPRMHVIAPEEVVLPANTGLDINTARLCGFATTMTGGELQLRGVNCNWDWELASPTRNLNPVKRQRNVGAHVSDKEHAEIDLYEIYELFVYFPYGTKNGADADLYCVWDRTSARILYLGYNPYDSRPFSVGRYQLVPHSFFGLGVLEMLGPYEKEITDWHNFRMANAKLVGSRAWGVKLGSPMSGFKLRIVPNKPLYFNSPDDLKEFRMADVYPSVLQYEQASLQMADKRVGTTSGFTAGPAPGRRTPGITMLSVLQAINKRFTTAFEEIRAGEADAFIQCVLRMQEVLKGGGEQAARLEDTVTRLLGHEDAERVFRIFRDSSQSIRDKLIIEMTASSQSINREADKQSSLQVIGILGNYYDKMLSLAMAVANPQLPPQMKGFLVKVATNASEAMDKFLKTFDQIRDTHTFLLSEDDFNALVQQQGGGLLSGGMGEQGQGMGGQLPGGPAGGAEGMAGGAGAGGGLGLDTAGAGGDFGAPAAGIADTGGGVAG